MTGRKLSIDSVAAFAWGYVNKQYRASLCALASLPDELSILDWYEIGEAERVKLRVELADIIEHNASRQRAEWCQKARAVA